MAVNVIIPIKDTAPEYFEQCLYSLATQTKKSFITTVIDDFSTEENSIIYKKIIDKMPYEVLYYKNKKNLGPGLSRQVGMDLAPPYAEFFMFLDSDDMLYPRAVEIMLHEAKMNNADIIRGQILSQGNQKSYDARVGPEISASWVTGKLFKKNFLQDNDIRFSNKIKYSEDSYFGLVAHNYTKKIYEISEFFYYWRMNKDSVTNTKKYNFAQKYNLDYFKSQYYATLKILEKNPDWNFGSVMSILYSCYQQAKVLEKINDLKEMDELLKYFFSSKKIQEKMETSKFLSKAYQNLKQVKDSVEFLQTYRSWINEKKEEYKIEEEV